MYVMLGTVCRWFRVAVNGRRQRIRLYVMFWGTCAGLLGLLIKVRSKSAVRNNVDIENA